LRYFIDFAAEVKKQMQIIYGIYLVYVISQHACLHCADFYENVRYLSNSKE